MFQGIIIGFGIAAPVGPVGILCIRRTLLSGRKSGLATGLGAATADAIYGSIAAFGVTFISSVLVAEQFWLRLFGGTILCYMGAKALFSKSTKQVNFAEKWKLRSDYTSTLLLAITNPIAIVYFAAVFSALNGTTFSGLTPELFVSGIFLGSISWWIILTVASGIFIKKIDAKMLQKISIVSGLIILGFGAYFLLSLWPHLGLFISSSHR